jgi:hypothetical protein
MKLMLGLALQRLALHLKRIWTQRKLNIRNWTQQHC